MRLALGIISVLVLVLAACGDDTGSAADEPGGQDDVPAADDLVTTRGPVTVIDEGKGQGAKLCLGAVLTSLPPQCGGPTLVGWNWADHDGEYERSRGVRWGDFVVTGTFDGTDFTPTEVVPASAYEAPLPDDSDEFATPCPEPDGGWRVLDPAKTTDATMEQTIRAASGLDGYAGLWVDQSINPLSTQDNVEDGMNDPTKLIINVRVTGDPEVAETTLRETWGGALCVTRAEHTHEQLRRVQDALSSTKGVLTTSVNDQQVELEVVYDDGSLQARLDDKYGEGIVAVRSALQPVPE